MTIGFSARKLLFLANNITMKRTPEMQNAQRRKQFDIGFTLADLNTQVYQGSLESPPWRTFLHDLREAFACDIALLLWGKAGAASPLTFADFHPNLTTAHTQPFFDVSLLEEAESAFEQVVDGRGMVMFGNSTVLRPDSLQTVMLGFDMERMMGIMIAPCGLPVFLGLFRQDGATRFSQEEIQHLSMIRPHLDQAMRAYLRIKRGEVAERLYADTISHLTIGAVLFDGRGRVIGTNDAARRIFENPSFGITVIDDQLVLAKNNNRRRFHAALTAALMSHACGAPDPFVDAMRIDTPPGELGIIVRLAPKVDYQTAQAPAVIVYLDTFKDEPGPTPEVICELFGLTPSESRLVALLAEGFSLQEAAQRLALSESSARTYSKKIFSKVGVSRQAELVSLVMKSATVLAG